MLIIMFYTYMSKFYSSICDLCKSYFAFINVCWLRNGCSIRNIFCTIIDKKTVLISSNALKMKEAYLSNLFALIFERIKRKILKQGLRPMVQSVHCCEYFLNRVTQDSWENDLISIFNYVCYWITNKVKPTWFRVRVPTQTTLTRARKAFKFICKVL